MGISKGNLILQVEGTLQLWLPAVNSIHIEFKLSTGGKIEGTVKEIELNIAGQALLMKDVAIGNNGLKVAEAQLTIKAHETATKIKPKDRRCQQRHHHTRFRLPR